MQHLTKRDFTGLSAHSSLERLADHYGLTVAEQFRDYRFDNPFAWVVAARCDGCRTVAYTPELDDLGDTYIQAGYFVKAGFRVTIYRGRYAKQ